MKRGIKLAGYVAWFMLMFFIGIYLTFPLDDLKPQVIGLLEDALGKGKQGTYGVDPKVTMGSLSLSGFGVATDHVSVQLGSRDPDPGPTIDVDSLALGVRPWSLLGKSRTVWIDADLYGGSISGTVSLDDKGQVMSTDLEVDGIDLGKAPALQAAAGLPMTGKLDADIDLDLGPTPEKDGEGKVKLALKGLTLGPGSPKAAAAFGGFSLPNIDLGNLTGEIPVKQGKGTLEGVKVDGKDLQLELAGDVVFKGKLSLSRLDLDGWFMPTPSLFEKDPKLKTLMDVIGGPGSALGKAKDDEGHYRFQVKGTIGSPVASLARDAGAKRAKRAMEAKAREEKKEAKEKEKEKEKEKDKEKDKDKEEVKEAPPAEEKPSEAPAEQ